MSKKTVQESESKSFQHQLAGKYLTFRLKGETYGCPISPINDIIEMQEVTKVPQTRSYVEGVINLRGTVVPVINLRDKFQMEKAEYDRQTCIVVVELDNFQTGLIVDQVQEVREVSDEEVEPAPGMGHEINKEMIAGMGKLEKEVVILLNLERILGDEEKDELREMHDDESG